MVAISRILSTAAVLLVVTTAYCSEKPVIRSLRIVGKTSLPQDQLLGELHSRENGIFLDSVLTRDTERLREFYQGRGYYFAEVHVMSLKFSEDGLKIDVALHVDEGGKVTVGKIILEGNTAILSQAILDDFETRRGNILLPQTLERDIEKLISKYERRGYPFVSVEIADIYLSDDSAASTIELHLSVHEGEKVTLAEIRIKGNTETRENVIVRETHLALPQLYDEEKVEKIPGRLNKLNIFSDVHTPEVYTSPRGDGLLIGVQEGRTNTFDGIIGYLPASGEQESGTFTGFVNISMRNLFGTARRLRVRWQKEEQRSQEIAFGYVEPWFAGFPVDLGINFLQREQDTIYVRRVIGGDAHVSLFDDFSFGGVIEQEQIIPSSEIISQAVFSSKTTSVGVDVHYDSKDDPVSPRRGVEYGTTYQIGNKKTYGSSTNQNSTVQKIALDANFFMEPVDRQVLMVGLHGRQITSDNIELGDEFRLGGTNSLRGFRENQFVGSRIAWTNTEYRFLLARRSFVFGFFDTGYYFLPENELHSIPSEQHLRFGYGFGMRVETSLGNIGVSIALGQGDPVSQAKLHVSVMNDF